MNYKEVADALRLIERSKQRWANSPSGAGTMYYVLNTQENWAWLLKAADALDEAEELKFRLEGLFK